MQDVKPIMDAVIQGVASGNERYQMLDPEHLLDNVSGVKFHLYPDSFKITVDDKVIATQHDFNPIEQGFFQTLKDHIEKQYQKIMSKNRDAFISAISKVT